MYKIKIKDATYNVPKESIGLLAHTKGYTGRIFDYQKAVEYLESLGCKIEEV